MVEPKVLPPAQDSAEGTHYVLARAVLAGTPSDVSCFLPTYSGQSSTYGARLLLGI